MPSDSFKIAVSCTNTAGQHGRNERDADVQPAVGTSLVDRMIGVVKLDIPTYESIERDRDATTQALIVVAIVAIAGGIGAIRDDGVSGLIGGLVGAIVGWIVFSFVAYFVGTRLIPGENTAATPGELLRTIGFAQTPGVLSVFGLLGVLGAPIVIAGGIWGIVTAIVGLKTALEMSTGRAIATGIIAAIASVIIVAIIMLPFGLAAWAIA